MELSSSAHRPVSKTKSVPSTSSCIPASPSPSSGIGKKKKREYLLEPSSSFSSNSSASSSRSVPKKKLNAISTARPAAVVSSSLLIDGRQFRILPPAVWRILIVLLLSLSSLVFSLIGLLTGWNVDPLPNLFLGLLFLSAVLGFLAMPMIWKQFPVGIRHAFRRSHHARRIFPFSLSLSSSAPSSSSRSPSLCAKPWTVSADQVCARLHVDKQNGLSPEIIAARLKRHGRNETGIEREMRKKRKGIFRAPSSSLFSALFSLSFWGLFINRLYGKAQLFVLVVCSAFSIISPSLVEFVSAFSLTIALLFAEALLVWRGRRGKHLLTSSPRQHETMFVHVLRDGFVQRADRRDLVIGDIALLYPGMEVPADLRLLLSSSLYLDESLLTGESLHAAKDASVVLQEGEEDKGEEREREREEFKDGQEGGTKAKAGGGAREQGETREGEGEEEGEEGGDSGHGEESVSQLSSFPPLDCPPMAWQGATVIRGYGAGVVVRTGENTRLAKTAAWFRERRREDTEGKRGLGRDGEEEEDEEEGDDRQLLLSEGSEERERVSLLLSSASLGLDGEKIFDLSLGGREGERGRERRGEGETECQAERSLRRASFVFSFFSLLFALSAVALGFWQGLSWQETILFSLALLVCLLPFDLPALAPAVLSPDGGSSLVDRGIYFKSLHSLETFSLVDTLFLPDEKPIFTLNKPSLACLAPAEGSGGASQGAAAKETQEGGFQSEKSRKHASPFPLEFVGAFGADSLMSHFGSSARIKAWQEREGKAGEERGEGVGGLGLQRHVAVSPSLPSSSSSSSSSSPFPSPRYSSLQLTEEREGESEGERKRGKKEDNEGKKGKEKKGKDKKGKKAKSGKEEKKDSTSIPFPLPFSLLCSPTHCGFRFHSLLEAWIILSGFGEAPINQKGAKTDNDEVSDRIRNDDVSADISLSEEGRRATGGQKGGELRGREEMGRKKKAQEEEEEEFVLVEVGEREKESGREEESEEGGESLLTSSPGRRSDARGSEIVETSENADVDLGLTRGSKLYGGLRGAFLRPLDVCVARAVGLQQAVEEKWREGEKRGVKGREEDGVGDGSLFPSLPSFLAGAFEFKANASCFRGRKGREEGQPGVGESEDGVKGGREGEWEKSPPISDSKRMLFFRSLRTELALSGEGGRKEALGESMGEAKEREGEIERAPRSPSLFSLTFVRGPAEVFVSECGFLSPSLQEIAGENISQLPHTFSRPLSAERLSLSPLPFDEGARDSARARVTRLMERGLVVEGYAVRSSSLSLSEGEKKRREEIEGSADLRSFTLLGFLCFEFQIRDETPSYLSALKDSGVRVVLATEESERTAFALGMKGGMFRWNESDASGPFSPKSEDVSLSCLSLPPSSSSFLSFLPFLLSKDVYGRASVADKVSLLELLQQAGRREGGTERSVRGAGRVGGGTKRGNKRKKGDEEEGRREGESEGDEISLNENDAGEDSATYLSGSRRSVVAVVGKASADAPLLYSADVGIALLSPTPPPSTLPSSALSDSLSFSLRTQEAAHATILTGRMRRGSAREKRGKNWRGEGERDGGRGEQGASAEETVSLPNGLRELIHALAQSRQRVENLRKCVAFSVGVKFGLALLVVICCLVDSFPFAPVQLLVLGLFLELSTLCTFPFEPLDADIMLNSPRRPSQPFFDLPLLCSLGCNALAFCLPCLLCFLVSLQLKGDDRGWEMLPVQSVAFLSALFSLLFLSLCARTRSQPLLRNKGLLSNPVMSLTWLPLSLSTLLLLGFCAPVRLALRVSDELALPTSAPALLTWVVVFNVSFFGVFWIDFLKHVLWFFHKRGVQLLPEWFEAESSASNSGRNMVDDEGRLAQGEVAAEYMKK